MNTSRYELVPIDSANEREFRFRDKNGNFVTNNDGEELIGAPIDDKSLVKRYFGRFAYGTQISIGIEQLLHPQIGAAVEHTGKFWRNPYNRVAISMDPIMDVVYADDQYVAGKRLAGFHNGIHGTDMNGDKFNAKHPDPFYWAHKTFERGVENFAKHYSREGLTDVQREQLRMESITWYSFYGMPMGNVVTDNESHNVYRKFMIDNVLRLEKNPSAERAIEHALDRKPPRPESVPKIVWPLARVALMPVSEVMSVLTIGELPEDIRKKFGIPFSRDEQKTLEDIRTIVKAFENPLPEPMRFPTVYGAIRRERGSEHGSVIDRFAYAGITVGSEAVRRTVGFARSMRSRLVS